MRLAAPGVGALLAATFAASFVFAQNNVPYSIRIIGQQIQPAAFVNVTQDQSVGDAVPVIPMDPTGVVNEPVEPPSFSDMGYEDAAVNEYYEDALPQPSMQAGKSHGKCGGKCAKGGFHLIKSMNGGCKQKCCAAPICQKAPCCKSGCSKGAVQKGHVLGGHCQKSCGKMPMAPKSCGCVQKPACRKSSCGKKSCGHHPIMSMLKGIFASKCGCKKGSSKGMPVTEGMQPSYSDPIPVEEEQNLMPPAPETVPNPNIPPPPPSASTGLRGSFEYGSSLGQHINVMALDG